MTLIRVNPFRELERSLDRFLCGGDWEAPAGRASREPVARTWAPSADVSESDHDLVFTMDIPGLEKEDIHISVDHGVLTVTGERKVAETETHDYHRVERWRGKVLRSFRLPGTVDAEKITAQLKNGVLTLVVPKKEEAKPREIAVSVQ